MSGRLPRQDRTARWAILSSVPLTFACVNSSVTPTSVRNSVVGNPAAISAKGRPARYTPMIHARAIERTPTLIFVVQLSVTAMARARSEMTGRFM